MIFALIASLAVTIISFVLYRHFTYWSRRGIKGPNFFDSIAGFRTQLYINDDKNYQKYGPIFGAYEFARHTLFLNDPELIKEMMVKQFHNFPDHRHAYLGSSLFKYNAFSVHADEGWKRIRSIISPAFSSGKLRYMMSSMNDLTDDFVENLAKVANEGNENVIDIKQYIGAFTMDVITNCAFGVNPRTLHNPNHPIVVNAKKMFNVDASFGKFLSMLAPTLAKLFNTEPIDIRSIKFFESLTTKIVNERKKENETNTKRNDFLQLVINAQSKDENSVNGNETNEVKGTLSMDELIAQGLAFFFAGYDTTGSALSHCIHYLSQNIECQKKLIMELETLNEFTNDSLANLKYLNAVIMETLRLAPPVTRIERTCVADCYLGGVFLTKGTIVATLPHAIQRDPKYFEDPDTFKPERFAGEASYDPYTYFPFGGGPRLCLGQRFAMNEMRMFLAKVIPKFSFHPVPNSKLEYSVGRILITPKETKVYVKIRK